MKDYLVSILHKESANTDRIYLYREGDYWYAHDNSALHLSFLLPEMKLYNHIHILQKISIISAMLYTQSLKDRIDRCIIHKLSDWKIEISIPGEKAKGLKKWKETNAKIKQENKHLSHQQLHLQRYRRCNFIHSQDPFIK